MTEYEYIIRQKEGLLDLFWGSKGEAKFAESSDDQR